MVGIADAGFVCIKSNMRGLGGAHRHRPYRFNIQPPEGGCQPRAAHCTAGRGFNTQPPEGGCDDDAVLVFAIDVSTHNHLKVAGYRAAAVKAVGRVVSTHNHPKVGGYLKMERPRSEHMAGQGGAVPPVGVAAFTGFQVACRVQLARRR